MSQTLSDSTASEWLIANWFICRARKWRWSLPKLNHVPCIISKLQDGLQGPLQSSRVHTIPFKSHKSMKQWAVLINDSLAYVKQTCWDGFNLQSSDYKSSWMKWIEGSWLFAENKQDQEGFGKRWLPLFTDLSIIYCNWTRRFGVIDSCSTQPAPTPSPHSFI